MRKEKLLHWGRWLLIALLLCSAVLLLRRTGYYAGIQARLERSRSVLGRTEELAGTVSAPQLPAAAMLPQAVTVRSAEGGGRYGAAYDSEETAAVFQRFSVDLSEALGSAGIPAERTEEDFRAWLDGCCVVFQFACPVQLELLAGWLGVEVRSDAAGITAQIVCLAAVETEALLCCRSAEGVCYACTTAVNADGFRSRASEYAPNGAIYAWESDRLADGGDTLLLSSAPTVAGVRSAVPLVRGEEADAMLTAMGMNSFLASSYSESDGTVVYVSEDNTLRISPTGAVFYRRAGTPDAGRQDRLVDVVGRAWQVAEQTVGPYLGDGALRFAGVEYNASQRSYTVLLDYVVDGIPVRLGSGYAAELVVRGDTVIQVRLQLRRFSRMQERTEMLPCLQAAAIAARVQGRPELVYTDAGDATACTWVIANG